MKILITGVAGFIGSNLAKKLLDLNFEITGIDNLSYGSMNNIKCLEKNRNFTFIYGDLLNSNNIRNLKIDTIVHLASQKIPRYDNSLRTLDENKLMIDILIDKCLKDNIKMVFASTSDVYGKNNNLPFNEESDLVIGPTNVKRWAYAVSKIYGEHLIIANSDNYGLKYSIARFFGSYGYNQNLTWWGGPQSVFIGKAIKNDYIEIHGDGLQTRTFTFIEDTIDQLKHLIIDDKSNNEIFNIASLPNEEISIIDLAKLIWSMINSNEAKIKYIPYSNFGKYEDVKRRVPSIDKISNYFNVKPRFVLKEGLKRTINWQKAIQNIKYN